MIGQQHLLKIKKSFLPSIPRIGIIVLVTFLHHPSTESLRSHTNFDTTTCESCILAKQHKLPFRSRQELEVTEKLQLVHSDLCGPLPPSIDGSTYFITFTDDYSRYSWVYGIPNKKSSTIKVKFDEWIKDAHTKANKKVKYLRTDGGGEYTGFLTPLYQPTVLHISQQRPTRLNPTAFQSV